MAEPSSDPKSPKTEPEKKQPETVLLSAEELRSSRRRGGGVYTPNPSPKQNPPTPRDFHESTGPEDFPSTARHCPNDPRARPEHRKSRGTSGFAVPFSHR